MTTIEELRAMAAKGELTYARVHAECVERERVIGTLVGWLYPSVLRSEIRELRALLLPPWMVGTSKEPQA